MTGNWLRTVRRAISSPAGNGTNWTSGHPSCGALSSHTPRWPGKWAGPVAQLIQTQHSKTVCLTSNGAALLGHHWRPQAGRPGNRGIRQPEQSPETLAIHFHNIRAQGEGLRFGHYCLQLNYGIPPFNRHPRAAETRRRNGHHRLALIFGNEVDCTRCQIIIRLRN